METRFINGVKVLVTPTQGTNCRMQIGEAHGGMFDGHVQFRVYTNSDFALVKKAFPTLGWHKNIDHLNLWSSEKNRPEIEAGFLI